MTAPSDKLADFASHHIEGYARAAMEAGRDGHFRVDLITEVLPNLWTGGCINGVKLGPDFDFVLSLYPWEKYTLEPSTQRVEVALYDAAEIPDRVQLYDLADLINREREKGRVLVHCQAGLNRSGLLTALSLVVGGMTPVDAIALLREKRCPMVLCNETFERWLLEQGSRAA